MAEKTIEQHVEDINKKFKDFNTLIESSAKKEDFDGLKTELGEIKEQLAGKDEAEGVVVKLDNLIKSVETQGLAIGKMNAGAETKVKTLHEVLTEKMDDLTNLRDRKIVSMKATVQSSDIGSDNVGMVIPGAGRMADRMPFLRDLFGNSQVGANSHNVVFYTDQTTNTNAAAAFEEAASIPSTSDITWTAASLDIENVGDSIKIAQRMINNIDFVEGEVKNFLTKNVQLKVDGYLWNGTGSNQPFGVTTRATAYAAGSYAASYQDANLMDLMRVCRAIAGTGTPYLANYAVLNIVDAEKYLYGKKDLNNNYIIPQNGGMISLIGGMNIIVNNGVTANSMVVGDFTYGVVYDQKLLNLEFGYVANDFQDNLVTLKGYEELNLLIRSVHTGAFQYVSDIETAISGLDAPTA